VYAFAPEQEVTVEYPPTPRYPRGRIRNGVIARRSIIDGGERRYTVLFDNDQADTLIPEFWIKPRAQVALSV
jgi:hypothetical protein